MEERIRQRRALFTVLREWLDEPEVLQALQIFEDRFQGQPSIAVHDYLTRIAPLYQDKVDTKTLRRNLMQILVRHSADLAPDPLPLLQQWRGQQQKSAPGGGRLEASADQLALHALVSNMMRKLPVMQRKQLHASIAQQLKKRFVNGSYDLLAQYLLSDNPLNLAGFDDTALRDFFSLIYVAACEVLGPVNADRWCAGGLTQLRQQDAAFAESVNRYL